MAKKMTQRDRVLMYIGEFGSISRREAFLDLGIVELSSRIGELESMGVRFNRQTESSKNRYGETVTYTRYSLAKKEGRQDNDKGKGGLSDIRTWDHVGRFGMAAYTDSTSDSRGMADEGVDNK